MKPGRFISFEGGEGAGKSTQARLLGAALEARGIDVVMTREPGGTAGAEAIRGLLLDTGGTDWNLPSEALLFAAARADHVSNLINPALAAGKWVICDRFIDSTRAYQGGEGLLPDKDLMALHQIGSSGLMPDLTLLIEVDESVAEKRIGLRDGAESDRIGGRDAQFHAGVTKRFKQIAQEQPRRVIPVDGNGTANEIHERILLTTRTHFGLAG